jgi:hypothetical protein
MKISHLFLAALLVFSFSCKKPSPELMEAAVSDTAIVKEYYSTGTIKSEISAIGQLRQGWTRNYDQSGRLISEVFYVDNVREGPARNYYAKSGKLNSTLQYKNGIKEGDEIWYYESGQPYRISPFVNGQIEGIQRLYFENGEIMAEVPYKAGMPGMGLKEYKADGTLITDYPKLVIRREDHLRQANKVLLMISLSEPAKEARFYKGPLKEGKYLHKELLLLASPNGIAQIDYNIPPGAAVNQSVVIAVNVKTRYGNPLVMSKTFNLQVINTQ